MVYADVYPRGALRRVWNWAAGSNRAMLVSARRGELELQPYAASGNDSPQMANPEASRLHGSEHAERWSIAMYPSEICSAVFEG